MSFTPGHILQCGEPQIVEVCALRFSSGHQALIDSESVWLVENGHWAVDTSGYVKCASGAHYGQRLHRMIVAAGPGEFVDHISGNRLDNRCANLRKCTAAENARNAAAVSGFKGVWWNKLRDTWNVQITVNGRCICVGTFRDEVEAAEAYDKAARRYFGDFARLNFPDPAPPIEFGICKVLEFRQRRRTKGQKELPAWPW